MDIAHISHHATGQSSDVQVLEHRLIEGERRIALAAARGEDISRLEDFWIDLLHQYEAAVDALPEAA